MLLTGSIAGLVLALLGALCILGGAWQVHVQHQRLALLGEAAGEFQHFVVRLIVVSSLFFIASNAAEVAAIEYGVTRVLSAVADFCLGCCSLMGACLSTAHYCYLAAAS